MQLAPDVISNLRTLLVSVDEYARQLGDVRESITVAEDAAVRLNRKIADLDQQAADAAAPRFQPDQARVQQIVAGNEVPLPDKKDIEARAQTRRHVAAQRAQLVDDVAAVRDHLATLGVRLAAIEEKHTKATVAFLLALGNAHNDVFRVAAVAFVQTHVPPLRSIADLIAKKGAARPAWWFNIQNNLQVGWSAPRDPIPGHPGPTPGMVVLAWPRVGLSFENKLINGELSTSPDIVEGLIAAIRAEPKPADAGHAGTAA